MTTGPDTSKAAPSTTAPVWHEAADVVARRAPMPTPG